MSPSQKSRKLSLKPRRRSLLSEKLTIVDQVVQRLVCKFEKKIPTLANQNWRKNRQKGLTNKRSLYIFLQKSDVTEHD